MIEASWQPDPDDGQRLRWWDGSQWTEHVAPGPGGEEVGSAPMRTTVGPPVSPGLAPATPDDQAGPAAEVTAASSADPEPGPGAAHGTGETDRAPAVDHERPATSPVWTAAAATGTPEDAASARPPTTGSPADRPEPASTASPQRHAPPDTVGGRGARDDPGRGAVAHAPPGGHPERASTAPDPRQEAARVATPATGAGPVWTVGAATAADDRSKRPFVTARAVHRIVAAIGVVMLTVASIQMITLRSVSGDSVAEAFYNAVGWGLLGATIWGVCVYSMREIDAERAEARDRAGGPAAGRTP